MVQGAQNALPEFVYDSYENAECSLRNMRLGTMIAYSHEVLKHSCPWDDKHPENAIRITSIMNKYCIFLHNFAIFLRRILRLTYHDLIARIFLMECPLRDDVYDYITAVHTPRLFNWLKQLSINGNVDFLENEARKYDSIYFNRVS